jgi:signal transduction histidine kinase
MKKQDTPDPVNPGRPHEPSIWRIAASEFRRAPRWVRLGAAFFAIFMGVVALQESGVGGGGDGWRRPATWGALLGALSGILIGMSSALYQIAQGPACNGMAIRLETHRLHPMLLAMPVLAFAGGVLSAVSLTLLMPFALTTPTAWLAVGAVLLVLVSSALALSDATRFLYRHAVTQTELAERARVEAGEAQLAALQAQLDPHFLFNALNTVASLVRTDPRSAEATVENLARILRRTLDRSRKPSIPLSDELDYLRAYLAIEKARFGDRLALDWRIDPHALDCRVPPMSLQPLVENSLKHGLAQQLEGGHVRIAAIRSNGRLRLEVGDDGPGFAPGYADGTGLGNLRRRLETLYGESARLEVAPPNGRRGATVAIELPARS